MSKFLIAAAALLVSTGASAQSAKTSNGAAARHAVLANIIDRVQMDALIDTVVDVEVTPTRAADTTSASLAANIVGDTARSSRVRRDRAAADALIALPTRG
jgi:hypothetical protein